MPERIRMFVPIAIRAIAESLATRMGSVAKTSVCQAVDLNPLIYRRIVSGEPFDIGLTNPPFVRSLALNGRIDDTSHRPFGTVPLALGRRKGGAAGPVARNRDGVAALLGQARSIVYVGAGTSGQKYLGLLDRLRLARSVGPKSLAMERGTVIPAVLSGQAELVAAPLTVLLAHPCLEPAAVLPQDLGTHIELSAFVRASPLPGALALLQFLLSADLDGEFARAGLLRLSAPSGVGESRPVERSSI